jgi:NAD+ synthase
MATIVDLEESMKIDCKKVNKKVQEFIHEKISENNLDGVCLGVSGGVDSSVAASICTDALDDPGKVHGLHLYDRDSSSKFTRSAGELAENLGINYDVRDISPMVREQGAYNPWIMKLVPYSNLVNKMILLSNEILSPILYGSSPFEVTLKRHDPSKLKIGFVAGIARNIENGFNIRHVTRRRILEEYSEKNNLLLVGAANRAEAFVGWFVKDGVDDLPIELIMDLYKGQVRQLAEYYDVPESITREKPSPDMFKGLGDEDLIGHKYTTIDKVAYVYENGLAPETAYSNGVSKQEYEKILTIHELSAWKRENPHEYPKLH